MDRSERTVFTNMCMVSDGRGSVLVQNRRDPGWPGFAFPGGARGAGGSFTEAVIREVYEETGLTIRNPRLCGIKDWYDDNGRCVVLLYRADRFSGEPRPPAEGEVRRMKLDEMRGVKPAEGMGNLLRVFLDEELSEYHFFRENGEWRERLIRY